MPTKRKQNTCDAPMAKEKTARHNGQTHFTRPVRIEYQDHRGKLLDSDNGWTKYFTDALVSSGILRDDTTKEIPHRPAVQQKKTKQESLTITITEA